MLLPSAFPFDVYHQPQTPTSNTTPSSSSPRGPFISLSSCRALQAILGIRPALPLPSIIPNTLGCQRKDEKPAICARSEISSPERAPLSLLKPNIRPPPTLRLQTWSQTTTTTTTTTTGPHGRTNKRNRADFESTDDNILVSTTSRGRPDSDHFPRHPHHHRPSHTSTNTVMSTADGDGFSTPKRQCRVPLLMPLGLSAKDFEGLDPSPKAQPQAPKELDFPFATSTTGDGVCEPAWSAANDRMLVSTVLDKLNLSRKDWSDCPRRTEKEGDRLGKRWGVLVGDGDVALRKGTGGRSRPERREVFLDG